VALLLIRHTTPAVAPGTCYGLTDLDVHESFAEEAESVLAALPPIAALVSSPLTRTRKLAARIAAARGLPLTPDPRLREMDFGRWEGLSWSAIARAELDEWAENFLHARPHGGESVAELGARVGEGLAAARTLAARSGGLCAVVTHSGVIKAALDLAGVANAWRKDTPFGAIVPLD
jgi:alpha-ribazole phosphatase